MTLSAIRAVFAKEVLSLTRDRHILIYSVFVPAFLYPALFLGVFEVTSYVKGVQERRESRVLLEGDESATAWRRFVERRDAEARDEGESPSRLRLLRSAAEEEPDPARIRARLESSEPGESVDAVLSLRRADEPDAAPEAPPSFRARIWYRGTRDESVAARERLESLLEAWRGERLLGLAREAGGGAALLDALEVEEESLSSPREFANHIAGLVLPLLMLFMTALGSFYPALDATVGEKERGTLETSLLSPVPRSALVLGKYLAVTSMSFTSFLLNFAGMSITILSLPMLDRFALDLRGTVTVLAGAALLAALFSALMMLVAFLARTFKEGQSYVTPIYLLTLAPLALVMRPEVSLNPTLALVPIVNTTLLFRAAIEQVVRLSDVVLVLASSALWAALALWLASRVLARESVATGQEGGWRQIARALRGSRAREEVAS